MDQRRRKSQSGRRRRTEHTLLFVFVAEGIEEVC
jgi:hypothetical protein